MSNSFPSGLRTHRIFFLIWAFFLAFSLIWNYHSILKIGVHNKRAYLRGYDPNFYYAWGRSLAFDNDIDFHNELHFLSSAGISEGTKRAFQRYIETTPLTPTGYTKNKYAMGAGLFAIPPLAAVDGFLGIYESITDRTYSRFSPLFPLVYVWTQIVLGFLGLLAAYLFLASRFGIMIAGLSVGAGTFSLSLWYYLQREAGFAHSAGFFCGTIAVLMTIRWIEACRRALQTRASHDCLRLSFWLGVVLGITTLVRFPNAAFGLVPLVYGIHALLISTQRSHLFKLLCASAFFCFVGILIGFSPQLFAWKAIFGDWLTYSYAGEQLYAVPRHALKVLFGFKNSLFLSTPIALLAVVGLLRGVAFRDALSWSGLAVFIAMVWIYGGWADYSLGGSYGQRGFVDFSFFFLCGIAYVLDWVFSEKSRRIWIRYSVLGVFIIFTLGGLYGLPAKLFKIKGESADVLKLSKLPLGINTFWNRKGDLLVELKNARGGHSPQ